MPDPKPLIRDGVLNHRVARREFLTRDEILSQLRLKGITEIADVHRAYIEPNGSISIIQNERSSG